MKLHYSEFHPLVNAVMTSAHTVSYVLHITTEIQPSIHIYITSINTYIMNNNIMH